MEVKWSIILTSIVVAVFMKWAAKLLDWVWFRPRKLEKILREQGLSGNPHRPIIGDLIDYIAAMKERKQRSIKVSDDILPNLLPYHLQLITKHGLDSFMWFGPWPRLNIVDPELMKEILMKPDVYYKPLPEVIKRLAGGLVSLEGEIWAKHRKIVNPAFHLEKLKNMVPAICLSCSSMIDKWEAIVSSSNEGWCEIDVWTYLQDLTGDVISRTAFSSSYEEGRRIIQLQRERVELTLQLMQFTMIPGWRYLPTKVNRKEKAMTNEIQSLIRGIINKRQKAKERGEATPSDDLLGIMMESNSRLIQEHGNKNAGMSTDDVIEECMLFYVAGSETTATLLVWTIILLCEHPEWQTKAREEVLRVLNNSEPSFEVLNQLKTVTMILQEVLRLYPPVSWTVRGPTKTVKLGNLTIPAGVQMTLLIALLNYDPIIWGDDAKEFNPQRFAEGVSNAAKIQSAFLPFGSGPRVCIGQNFAMIETKLVLAMILQRFSFELSPSYLHAPFAVLTLQPQHGAPIILRNLESSIGS